jgi:hypothetical protein
MGWRKTTPFDEFFLVTAYYPSREGMNTLKVEVLKGNTILQKMNDGLLGHIPSLEGQV